MVRCTGCRTINGDDQLTCRLCGNRLVAWLGDPFGNLELPDAQPRGLASVANWPAPEPAAARPSRAGGFPLGKLIFSVAVLWLLSFLSPGGAAILTLLCIG